MDDGTLPLTRKCALSGVSRAALYYRPRPVDAETLKLQLVVDKLYMRCPYYGSRRVMFHLRRDEPFKKMYRKWLAPSLGLEMTAFSG